jgi:hypothetical protein
VVSHPTTNRRRFGPNKMLHSLLAIFYSVALLNMAATSSLGADKSSCFSGAMLCQVDDEVIASLLLDLKYKEVILPVFTATRHA